MAKIHINNMVKKIFIRGILYISIAVIFSGCNERVELPYVLDNHYNSEYNGYKIVITLSNGAIFYRDRQIKESESIIEQVSRISDQGWDDCRIYFEIDKRENIENFLSLIQRLYNEKIYLVNLLAKGDNHEISYELLLPMEGIKQCKNLSNQSEEFSCIGNNFYLNDHKFSQEEAIQTAYILLSNNEILIMRMNKRNDYSDLIGLLNVYYNAKLVLQDSISIEKYGKSFCDLTDFNKMELRQTNIHSYNICVDFELNNMQFSKRKNN